jgi:hypothetical protein
MLKELTNWSMERWRDRPGELRSGLEQKQFYRDSSPNMKRLMMENLEQVMRREVEQEFEQDSAMIKRDVGQRFKELEATPEQIREEFNKRLKMVGGQRQ